MKQAMQILRLGLAALLLVATAPTLLATPRGTGIEGRATLYISYGTPTEVEPGVWVGVGDVQMPVATSFRVLSAHSHRVVGRYTTDAEGAFSVPLPPGKYIVVPDALTITFGSSIPASPFEVTVKAKHFTPVSILYYQSGPISVFGTRPQ